MSQTQTAEEHVELAVESIGGIDTTEIVFSPGVTPLTGRNATNRTSLLQALMATLGSDHVSLKGDADHGEVTPTPDGKKSTLGRLTVATARWSSATIPIWRTPKPPSCSGSCSDPTRPAKRARDDELREVIMHPVDATAVNAEIEQLDAEKRQLDDLTDRRNTLRGDCDRHERVIA